MTDDFGQALADANWEDAMRDMMSPSDFAANVGYRIAEMLKKEPSAQHMSIHVSSTSPKTTVYYQEYDHQFSITVNATKGTSMVPAQEIDK